MSSEASKSCSGHLAHTKWMNILYCTKKPRLMNRMSSNTICKIMQVLHKSLSMFTCSTPSQESTMSHIFNSCPLTRIYGGLQALYEADTEALEWLAHYIRTWIYDNHIPITKHWIIYNLTNLKMSDRYYTATVY